MPQTHVVTIAPPPEVWAVTKQNGTQHHATIVKQDDQGALFHFERTDKRMDEWYPWSSARKVGGGAAPVDEESDVDIEVHEDSGAAELVLALNSSFNASARAHQDDAMDEDMGMEASTSSRKKKKKKKSRSEGSASSKKRHAGVPEREFRELGILPGGTSMEGVEGAQSEGPKEVVMTEAEYDLQHHEQIYAQKNFDKVYFKSYEIKTWYFSPYPLTDIEVEDIAEKPTSQPRIPKSGGRSHGRTLDLYVGGLQRMQTGAVKPSLWVCYHCFKYYAEPRTYTLHMRGCQVKFPPGQRVYHKGAQTIWEVDGAQAKLYCQNLSLFGKLFIDIKTLFFDCDNFLFYILCEGKTNEDKVVGFFSKEKVSFDDYNLACIVTLPPYQRRGYGMLMTEFSYELSRRAGKPGTPERPLSDLGLRSYLKFWISVLVRFFENVLRVLPPKMEWVHTTGTFPSITSQNGRETSEDSSTSNGTESQVNGVSSSPINGVSTNGDAASPTRRRRRSKLIGWAGEVDGPKELTFPVIDEPKFSTHKTYETHPNPDGSATTHVAINCTLEEIAQATNLRLDDAAFALNECGLLMQRLGHIEAGGRVIITSERVAALKAEFNVRDAALFPAYILLGPGQYTKISEPVA